MKTDWLIVGAGFTGAVLAERLASQFNQKVLVIDRRSHIAGNAFDYYDENGVLVHKYGPHIFHTNSQKVWDYLSRFTFWRPYFHHVLASVDGKLVPVPFNLNSLHALFPKSMASSLEGRLIERYGFGVKVPVLRLLEEADPAIQDLAKYIYKNVFEGYTTKQWALPPNKLDASVTGRVPVFISRDDRYFQDTYQSMPRLGYAEMFRRILAHPNIRILLKADYREVMDEIKFNRMIFTGPIDEFFNCVHGPLPYRSLRFTHRYEPSAAFQPTGQVNYPNEHSFTRITEFKYLTGQNIAGTTIAYEYPEPYEQGVNDPYYPIPRDENRERYELYLKEAQKMHSVVFAGRLADYKYYNMDQAVARALKVFDEIVLPERAALAS